MYTIKCFSFNKNIKFLQTGLNAFNHGFVVKVSDLFPANDPLRNKNGEISIFDYYKKKYGKTLNYPYLPLIETEKNGMFPMELATLLPNQKYNFKLDPVQVCVLLSLPRLLLIFSDCRYDQVCCHPTSRSSSVY